MSGVATPSSPPVADGGIFTQGDFREPYDWDSYAQVYFPKAEELVAEAEKAEKEGNREKASELYL